MMVPKGADTVKKRRVTAKEVAERAGVSTATVSMILNGKGDGNFPEKTWPPGDRRLQ